MKVRVNHKCSCGHFYKTWDTSREAAQEVGFNGKNVMGLWYTCHICKSTMLHESFRWKMRKTLGRLKLKTQKYVSCETKSLDI